MKLGIVLGAAATSGVNTYKALEDEKRRNEEFDRKRKEWEAEDTAVKSIAKPGEYKLDTAIPVDKLYTDKLGLSGDALNEALKADTTPDLVKARLAGALPAEEAGKYNFISQGGKTYAAMGELPKVSAGDYAANVASAFINSGNPTLMQKGYALKGLAQTTEKGDLDLGRERYGESVMRAGRAYAAGDVNTAVTELKGAYSHVPDGREVGDVKLGKKGEVEVSFVDKSGTPVGKQSFKNMDEALTRAAAMKDPQTWISYNQFVVGEENKMRLHRESQALQARLHGPQAELAQLELKKKTQVFGLINEYTKLLQSPESWKNVDQLRSLGSQIEALDPSTVKTFNRVDPTTGEVVTGTVGTFTGNLDKLKPRAVGDTVVETVQKKIAGGELKTSADIEVAKGEVNRAYGRGAWETYIEPRIGQQIQAIQEGKPAKASALPQSAPLPEYDGQAITTKSPSEKAWDATKGAVGGAVNYMSQKIDKTTAENYDAMLKTQLKQGYVNPTLLQRSSELMVKYPESFSPEIREWVMKAQLMKKGQQMIQEQPPQ